MYTLQRNKNNIFHHLLKKYQVKIQDKVYYHCNKISLNGGGTDVETYVNPQNNDEEFFKYTVKK